MIKPKLFVTLFVGLLIAASSGYSQCAQYGYGTSVNCITTGGCGSWYSYCVMAACQVSGRQVRCCPILTSTQQCYPVGCLVAWLANICLSCSYCAGGGTVAAALPTVDSPLHVAPYTMELWTYDASGILIQERKLARQSDGTEMERFSYSQQPQIGQGRLLSEPGGKVTSIFDRFGMKMSGMRGKEETSMRNYYMTDRGTGCANTGETVQRTETLMGLGANVIQRIEANTGRVFVYWRVPDLGCETVKLIGTQPDGKGGQKPFVSVIPKYVEPGEPDPSFFLQPAAYSEVKPSQFVRELGKIQGTPASQCATCANPPAMDEKRIQALDNAYAARQTQN